MPHVRLPLPTPAWRRPFPVAAAVAATVAAIAAGLAVLTSTSDSMSTANHEHEHEDEDAGDHCGYDYGGPTPAAPRTQRVPLSECLRSSSARLRAGSGNRLRGRRLNR
jgi:hypothetical protein